MRRKRALTSVFNHLCVGGDPLVTAAAPPPKKPSCQLTTRTTAAIRHCPPRGAKTLPATNDGASRRMRALVCARAPSPAVNRPHDATARSGSCVVGDRRCPEHRACRLASSPALETTRWGEHPEPSCRPPGAEGLHGLRAVVCSRGARRGRVRLPIDRPPGRCQGAARCFHVRPHVLHPAGHRRLVAFDRKAGRNLMAPAVSAQHLRDPRQRHGLCGTCGRSGF